MGVGGCIIREKEGDDLNKVLKGYVELIKAAETMDELREIGKDINLYLDTVAEASKEGRRSILRKLYQLNKVEIKAVGTRVSASEEQVAELNMEGGTIDFTRSQNGLVTVMIPDWLARERNIPGLMTGHIMHQTPKAALFRSQMDDLDFEGWLPLSQIRVVPVHSQAANRGNRLRQPQSSSVLDPAASAIDPAETSTREPATGGIVDHHADAVRYMMESMPTWGRNGDIIPPPDHPRCRSDVRLNVNVNTEQLRESLNSVTSNMADMMRRAVGQVVPAMSGIRAALNEAAESSQRASLHGNAYMDIIQNLTRTTPASFQHIHERMQEESRRCRIHITELAARTENIMLDQRNTDLSLAITWAAEIVAGQQHRNRATSNPSAESEMYRRYVQGDWATDRETHGVDPWSNMQPEEASHILDRCARAPLAGQCTDLSVVDHTCAMTLFEYRGEVMQVATYRETVERRRGESAVILTDDDVVYHISGLLERYYRRTHQVPDRSRENMRGGMVDEVRRMIAAGKMIIHRPIKYGTEAFADSSNAAPTTRPMIRWAAPAQRVPPWLSYETTVEGRRGSGELPQTVMIGPIFQTGLIRSIQGEWNDFPETPV